MMCFVNILVFILTPDAPGTLCKQLTKTCQCHVTGPLNVAMPSYNIVASRFAG